ncbi:MAG TPA: hypothetical protein VM638_06200, partial [Actinomycetota bacterium]|nr:hypothetical protein [Actinomycetota bacterium]
MTRRASVALLALLLLIALSSPAAAYPRPGRTDQVSVAPSGKAADGFVVYPSISGDGRHVVFVSDAPNLVAGISPEGDHVFAHDRATRRTEIVSVRSDGTLPPGRSKIATVSDDGRSVAFDSTERLVPEDTGDHLDIYVRDRALDVTRRASVGHDGRQANADAGLHGLSG